MVSDDSYPPYVFRDAEGTLRGILLDQWALWSRKTGVPVQFRAMDWADAQAVMAQNQADVIDTMFWTEERAACYRFSRPYLRIDVPVYTHQALGGISDAASLKGFTLGVKEGDSVIGHLAKQGITSIREYPSYEAVIMAAKNQEIQVFAVDRPPAFYFLCKHGIENQFKEAFVLYSGDFHRAVARDRPAVLQLIEEGFDRISPQEHKAIERKWLGTPFSYRRLFRVWGPWLLAGLAAILALTLLSMALARRVRIKTAQLETALQELKRSLAARERSEQALEQTLERYEILSRHNHTINWSIDRNGRFTQLGPTAEAIARHPPETLIGKCRLVDLHPEKGRDGFARPIARCLDQGEPIQDLIHPLLTPDGECAWFASAAIPIRDAAGTIVGAWGTSTDITTQHIGEEEKAHLQEQLRHAQKLESIGRLAGGIAHDFNNMLQAILGYTEIALTEIPSDQPIHNDLEEIRKAAHHSATLIRQLQAFARKQAVHPEIVELNDAIEEMLTLLERLIGKSVALRWQPGADSGHVKIDPGQLDQIVTNLVLNARDAVGPQGGAITIETGMLEIVPDTPSPWSDLTPGQYVRLTIRDNGCGMSAEIRERIFEPFFTTKAIGHGMGLATVYGVVTQNGGSIRVESEPGEGSVFEILLPRAEAPADAAPNSPPDDAAPPPPSAPLPASPDPTGASPSRARILVVEDEQAILNTIRRFLEALGYQVTATPSAHEALALFDAEAERIDLLISDVIMPEMNGPTMVQKMLARRADLKHLYMSGYTASLLSDHGLDKTGLNFLQKPFTLDAIAEAVQRILAA